MMYAPFIKRLCGGFIDFFVIYFVILFIGSWLMFHFFRTEFDMQEAPFLLILLAICPIYIMGNALQYPEAYGNDGAFYLLFAILFLVEVAYYSLLEILPSKRTIGHFFVKIRVYSENGNIANTLTIILRNCLKTLSRYCFALPLLTMFFTSKRQAIHDWFTKTIVALK